MTHHTRRTRLAENLPGDIDALLVTDLANVRYLSGFTGSNAALLLGRDGSTTLATDSRYASQAQQQCPDLPVVVTRRLAAALTERAAGAGAVRVGLEGDDVTLSAAEALRQSLPAGVELVPTSGLVERQRMVKDDAELAALTEACGVTVTALERVVAELRPGWTERRVAARLEWWMRELGAEAPAFESIVASGPNSAVPHHEPGDRPLARGDLVKIDCGARLDGYHADCTRTFVLGPAAGWQREVHAVVLAAQAAGREALAPGADVVAVDATARNVIAAAGYGEAFGHGLGHGVGLRIHEAPMLSPLATGILAERVPVTVEPGIYLPGRGGVRIEDTVVVRAGGAETLTNAPRELVELG